MHIEPLTTTIATEHRNELAHLYYANMQACSHVDHFTLEDAHAKIDSLIHHLGNGTCVAFGAFYENQLHGFIWAYPHYFREEYRMYVSEIRVQERSRNRGIGRRLLKLIEGQAKELGISSLYLHAEASNLDAIRFYESLGYSTERIQLTKRIV